jgi:hypothetical protein
MFKKIDCSDINLDPKADCVCHGAVLRAYNGMIAADRPEICALQVAKIVFAHHHPEISKSKAHLTVERWINEDRLQ